MRCPTRWSPTLTGIIEGAEKTSSVVVLRGAGADFCVGRAVMGSTPKQDPDALERRTFSDVVFNCYGAMRNAKIPIVAAVHGRALGFGCAIAAACDITLASDKAVFQVPEMAHNILPTMVMSSFVDRVPRKAMSYLVYSQAEIGPERALSFGIVSDVVPAAKLDDAVADALRRDSEGAAAGDPRRQGIRQDRARHGGVRRRRIRPQPARHRQFIARDAAEALVVFLGKMNSLPRRDGTSLNLCWRV